MHIKTWLRIKYATRAPRLCHVSVKTQGFESRKMQKIRLALFRSRKMRSCSRVKMEVCTALKGPTALTKLGLYQRMSSSSRFGRRQVVSAQWSDFRHWYLLLDRTLYTSHMWWQSWQIMALLGMFSTWLHLFIHHELLWRVGLSSHLSRGVECMYVGMRTYVHRHVYVCCNRHE